MRSIFIILLSLSSVLADFYSATSELEKLVDVDAFVREQFDVYISKTQQTQDKITEFLDYITILQEELEEPETYFGNPFNAISMINRLITDWKLEVLGNVLSNEPFEAYKNKLSDSFAPPFKLPTNDDLVGAARGLWRLQKTYKLKTADLAKGILLDKSTKVKLKASDCFEIGRNLFEIEKYDFAVEWLLQARELNMESTNSFPYVTQIDILEYLTRALNHTGNYKLGHKLNNEILKMDPHHELALSNRQLFERKLIEQRSLNPNISVQLPIPEKPSLVFDLYQRVCSGELSRSPRELRDLRCYHSDRGVPYRLLMPFKVEQLSADPFVAFYHNTISENEMNRLIAEGRGTVERSQVGDLVNSTTSEIRTSKNTWLWLEKNEWLHSLKRRLEDITGLSTESAEALQLVNYGIGGQYEPHYDFFEASEDFDWTGNRILTALFYINHVEMGGGTAFPYLYLYVPPVKGSLLVWYNLHTSLESDYRTKHAGCPVLRGSKWVCNEWFHETGQEFKRPCELVRDGYKSEPWSDDEEVKKVNKDI